MTNETEKAATAVTTKKAATRRKTAATKPPEKLAQALSIGGKTLLWAAEVKLIDTAPVEAKKRGRKAKAEAK